MLLSPKAHKTILAGVCSVLATIGGASAAVTYSGTQNIPIPTNFAGIYLDFTDETDATVVSQPTEGAVVGGADWDVNFFFSGVAVAYSPDFQPFIDDEPTPTNQSQLLNVAVDTLIDSTSVAGQILGVAGDGVSYGGSGSATGSPSGEDHLSAPDTTNPNYGAFTVGTPGYLAFVADVNGTTVYGWMQVTIENDGGTAGTIHDWAWNSDLSSGLLVGQVPEPGAAILVILGAAAFLRRRRS